MPGINALPNSVFLSSAHLRRWEVLSGEIMVRVVTGGRGGGATEAESRGDGVAQKKKKDEELSAHKPNKIHQK